jgi:hypothetical protein
MFRTRSRVLIGLATCALLIGALAGPAVGSTTQKARAGSSIQGIDGKTVKIVALISDLDGLRSRGVTFAPSLSTSNLLKRWQTQFDALGKINGYDFEVVGVTWDPAVPTSFEPACIKATQDEKPYMVVNANGFRISSIGCITVDNETFMFYGESVYDALQKASGPRLVSLGVPAEQSGLTAATLARKQQVIPKTAKIGLLSANEPAIKAAGDAMETQLKRDGYNVASKVEVNLVGLDTTGQNRESAAAVATMRGAGVDFVVVLIPFTANQGFFQEAEKSGAPFKYMLVDTASSLCTQFGATRVPPEVARLQVPCVTTWDTRAVAAKNAVKKDSAFEAQCRAAYDKAFNEKTNPGVPSGGWPPPNYEITEDMAPNECTIVNLFAQAFKKAGKNPTYEKLFKAFQTLGKQPGAYQSNGQGSFSKNKMYFSDTVHLETLSAASPQTPKDANGLYNGCPTSANCWIPQLVDGQEWFPVTSRGNGGN